MVLRHKTRLYNLSGNKYAIYIPKAVSDDSQFPFRDLTAPIEIVILPSKIEGLGKLLIKQLKTEGDNHGQRKTPQS